jgi:hypothetical protein
MGQLVFQATAGGQTALVGPNPSSNFSLNVPAVNGTLVTTGDTGTVTNTMLASSAYTAPGTIGSGTPNTGAFTTLSASSTVSGTGFSNYLASPPAIGGTTPSTGKFTTITGTLDASISGLTVGKGSNSLNGNSVFGYQALPVATTGATFNTAIGYQSGYSITTGYQNALFGPYAGYFITTGISNTGVGYNSMATGATSTGSYNSALGWSALNANTSGNNNVGIGYAALNANTTASNNTAVGYQAAYTNSTGASFTAIGKNALFSNTTGSFSTAVGNASGYSNTTGRVDAFGTNVLYANTTGLANCGFGGSYADNVASALVSNTTGNSNCAFGIGSLASNTTASNNTAVGYQAGYSNTTGHDNLFYGYQTGYANTTGNYNLFIGNSSGGSNTTGTGNTFVGGSGSGGVITTGSGNSILGNYSGNQGGLDIRTASNYIVLSDGSGNPRGVFDSSGNFLVGTTSNTNYNSAKLAVNGSIWMDSNGTGSVLGSADYNTGTNYGALSIGSSFGLASTGDIALLLLNTASKRIYVQNRSAGVYLSDGGTSWTSNSDERIKKNLVPIQDAANKVASLRAVIGEYIDDELQRKRPFLIAQDVDKVLTEAVDKTNDEVWGVQYSDVIPLLVAAIKELKAEIDQLKGK